MVRRMTGCVNGFNRPAVTFNHIAAPDFDIRFKGQVIPRLKPDFTAFRRTNLQAIAVNFAAMITRQRYSKRGVVNMVMRHKYMGHAATLKRFVECGAVLTPMIYTPVPV